MKQFFARHAKRSEWIVVMTFAMFMAVLVTYPSITHLKTAYIGDSGDNYEYAGYMGLAAHNILQGQWPFHHTNYWRYPVGFDFSRGFDSYLTIGLGTILTLLVGLPLSYNLVILLLLGLNGLSYYLFFREFTHSKTLGILGSIICGFSYYSIARAASHPNLVYTGGIALFSLIILRLVRKPHLEIKDYLLFFLSLLFIAIGSLEYFIITILFFFTLSFLTSLFFPSVVRDIFHKVQSSLDSFVMTASGALITFCVLYFPQLSALFNHTFVFLNRSDVLKNLTPHITDFFLPNSYLHLFVFSQLHALSTPSIEKLVFVGWIELLLFLLFLIIGKAKKQKLFFAVLIGIFFSLSLGYGVNDNFVLLPYHFLKDVFPFSAIPEAGRFSIISTFLISCTAVAVLTEIGNKKVRYVMIAIIGLLLCLERVPTSFYKADAFLSAPYIKAVQAQKSTAVLDIPVDPYYQRYDTLSLLYNKPIVNGYFHWSADGPDQLSFLSYNQLFDRYTCLSTNNLTTPDIEAKEDSQMLSLLSENGIRTIVVHKDDKYFHPICANVRERLNVLFPSTLIMQKAFPKEVQTSGKIIDGKSVLTMYFPQSGTFYLDGFYVASTPFQTYTITKDGAPIDFDYSWSVDPSNQATQIEPRFSLQTHVESGTSITFTGPEKKARMFYSVWYRYNPDPATPINPLKNGAINVFEDENTSVYQLQ